MPTPSGADAPGMDPTSASVGPVVVAVGGGHGLSASLRAIRRYAASVTAIVSVADDGGSSGALRAAMPDLPAPGDVRRCLGALSEDGAPFGRILEHRFRDGDLEGHALGNLLLVALALEMDSFADAVDEVALRVGAVGRVLPATLGPVELVGRCGQPEGAHDPVGEVQGQVAVQNATGVFEVLLQPEAAPSSPEVATAILGADQVIIGPGSLFTSVLAASIVPAVRDALQATSAQRVFVVNLAPQVPETEGFDVAGELAALARHGVPVDVVLADPSRAIGDLGASAPPVRLAVQPVRDPLRAVHDPIRLGDALAGLLA